MLASKTHHSAHSSRFLHPQCLHHLEHIHHSLRLAPLNSGGNGTEHTAAADCVTTGDIQPHSYTISLTFTHAYSTHYCTSHIPLPHTPPHTSTQMPTLYAPTHTFTHMPTHTYIHIHTDTPTKSHLQCITMGWLPVLLWTLLTSSITSVTVFRLEQLPSGAQLVMWNWLTCCALPDCKGGQVTCHRLFLQPPYGTNLGILDT